LGADFPGTVCAVTHDRYFLDNVAGWILELDRGQGIPFEGNYNQWLEAKGKRLEVALPHTPCLHLHQILDLSFACIESPLSDTTVCHFGGLHQMWASRDVGKAYRSQWVHSSRI